MQGKRKQPTRTTDLEDHLGSSIYITNKNISITHLAGNDEIVQLISP